VFHEDTAMVNIAGGWWCADQLARVVNDLRRLDEMRIEGAL